MDTKASKSRVFSREIIYPDSDGKPMADNTLQALWIVMLYDNFKGLFSGKDVFVAADLFWYPVEGDPNTKVAPDVMIAFDRPEGYRGSYKQWLENNIPPHVVFEVLSPSNSAMEMLGKRDFYDQYGVQEFIIIDPEKEAFIAYARGNEGLVRVNEENADWISPLLKISFRIVEGKLKVYDPEGIVFKTFEELKTEKEAALQEIERLKARLKELGENP